MALEEASILWCSGRITRPQAAIQVSCGSRLCLGGEFTRVLCSSVCLVFQPEADSLPGREVSLSPLGPCSQGFERAQGT